MPVVLAWHLRPLAHSSRHTPSILHSIGLQWHGCLLSPPFPAQTLFGIQSFFSNCHMLNFLQHTFCDPIAACHPSVGRWGLRASSQDPTVLSAAIGTLRANTQERPQLPGSWEEAVILQGILTLSRPLSFQIATSKWMTLI